MLVCIFYYIMQTFNKIKRWTSLRLKNKKVKAERLDLIHFYDSDVDEHWYAEEDLKQCLPQDFFHKTNHDLMQKAFWGVYAGNYCRRENTSFGVPSIEFPSTELPFVYEFAARCGVKEPIINIYPDYSYQGSKVKAGHHGYVKWQFRTNNDFLNDYNFAYSNIGRDEEQMHLNSVLIGMFNDRESFMAFFLGWFLTEGVICWDHVDIDEKRMNILVYHGAELASPRDQHLLCLFANKMRNDLGIPVDLYRDQFSKSKQIVLRLLNCQEMNMFVLEAIELFKARSIPLNGKLLWWEKLLMYNHKGYIFDGTAPPLRLTFLDYLGPKTVLLADHFTFLIGQDFYPLNLYQLNKLLEFCGYSKVKSTYDFNVREFSQWVLTLYEEKKLTKQQRVLLKYIDCCRTRLFKELRVANYQYLPPRPETIACDNADEREIIYYNNSLHVDYYQCRRCNIRYDSEDLIWSHFINDHNYKKYIEIDD
ncbi:uncharacterized protein BX663DRAFT_576639 [Cokeromyces recurvatus]|uniref:uncharacterized protein n=1 Tax=Cokeromyces recurvatus TaxID=90255 RepID=UPI00221EA83E|nr:uncharacterized protein BX663DRAFT_576639 [Cokeromyces recurvatus]KAI7899756.1 hypothetical protein BX663DRAFT_576639 [Cokeromyces recurvatus]